MTTTPETTIPAGEAPVQPIVLTTEEPIHLPANTYWPLILVVFITVTVFGILLAIWGHASAMTLAAGGFVLAMIPTMGWFNLIIKERTASHHPGVILHDLSYGVRLFLLSEAAIFAAFFAQYFYIRMYAPVWPPEGSPHLHTYMPAIATLLLMTSSVTCEFAHKALLKDLNGLCKNWMILTLLLGLVFLGIQGYEWGMLMTGSNFTVHSGVWGTIFYLCTGFHALHVATGLVLLTLVYGRLEMGHFSKGRHFAMNAASWYWHFVDVIWIFLFFCIYLMTVSE